MRLFLDSLYIHNGGGKVLLEYFVRKIELERWKVVYLFDSRLDINGFEIKSSNIILIRKGSIIARHRAYERFLNEKDVVFCFGNVPPFKKYKNKVITYFHQRLFLSVSKEIPTGEKYYLKLKSFVVFLLCVNTDFWVVQTFSMKNEMLRKVSTTSADKIRVIPFFDSSESKRLGNRKLKGSYIYVSDGHSHKNHLRLIEAFSKYYTEKRQGILYLTISDVFEELLDTISNYTKRGIPIYNLGFISRVKLSEVYEQTEYLIYPSLSESFGLGLLESARFGCKIIAADLPYVHAVCRPSLLFDPLMVPSIFEALVKSGNEDVNDTTLKVKNELESLLKLIQS